MTIASIRSDVKTNSISVDTISEKTAANGVSIDSVTLKDGDVTARYFKAGTGGVSYTYTGSTYPAILSGGNEMYTQGTDTVFYVNYSTISGKTVPTAWVWCVGSGGSTYASHTVHNLYAANNVSALSFTDRTPYPNQLQIAYDAVNSMEPLPPDQYKEDDKEQQLDHSKLHPYLRDGETGRDLSATVSAQNAVIKDLIVRVSNQDLLIASLMARIEALENKFRE